MTLTQRMALFIAFIITLALGGALVIHTLAARDVLAQQQDMRNRDAAATLALALSHQGADVPAMKAVATAQFDLGHYRQIALRGADGKSLFTLQRQAPAPRTPAWFAALLPMNAADGEALVSAGWREIGTVSVAAHTAWAQESLWQASTRSAALLATLALLAAVLTAWMLRAWQRPLQGTVAQAQALARGQFVEAPVPKLPELQSLTRSMNTTVQRLRENFAGQAEQVAYLQRQAQLDDVTGLARRAQFVAALNRQLGPPGSRGATAPPGLGATTPAGPGPARQDGLGLVLVRVGPLDRINMLHGREHADSVLRHAGQVLARAADAEPGRLAARLAGPDLALLLPLPATAIDAARALQQELLAVLLPLALGVEVHIVVSAGLPALDGEGALAQTLPGLGLALQSHGLHIIPGSLVQDQGAGLEAWASRIRDALQLQRAQLGEFPVLDAQGRLLHLECPLRLQLDKNGPYQSAAQWLPLARRSGLSPQVDQAALQLALTAIASDQRPRAINIELGSLATPGFIDHVTQALAAQPQAASRLWVEWVQSGQQSDWAAAEQASQAWRKLGVHTGVEHAGAAPQHLARLRDQGLDYVKVDAGHLRGAANLAPVRAYAQSLAGLIRLLGLKVLAEGVDSVDDLHTLWQLGFDGATGQALAGPLAAVASATMNTPAPPQSPQVSAPGKGHHKDRDREPIDTVY